MIRGRESFSPVSPSDPLRTEKTYAWWVLKDAICKSCFANRLDLGKVVAHSPEMPMLQYFTESRQWIVDSGEHLPFEFGFCANLLSAEIGSRDILTRYIRELWNDWDKRVVAHLMSMRRKAEGERRKSVKAGTKRGPVKGAKMIRDVDAALRVVKESKKWGR